MSRIAVLTAALALAGAAPALAAPTATITNGPGFSVPSAPSLPDHPVNSTGTQTFSFTYNGAGPLTVECSDYQVPGVASYGPCTTAGPTSGTFNTSGSANTLRHFDLRITDAGLNQIVKGYDWAIDTTAPTISVANLGVITSTATINHFLLGASATPGLSCSDNLSGVLASACVSNAALDTSDLDSHERTITATDRAGNSATPVKRSYRVDPPLYASLINANSPLAYWKLNEAPGATTAVDSAHGNNGTYQGHVALGRDALVNCELPGDRAFACTGGNGYVAPAASDSGTAAYFSGANGDHVRIDNVLAPTGASSIEAWVRPADASSRDIFEDGATDQLYISGGRFTFRWDANAAPVQSSTTVTPGTKYHVVGTWDGSVERIYVNGTLENSFTPAVITVATSAQPTAYIGYGRDASAAFHGTIDEVALYGSELTASAIKARYVTGTVTEPQYTYGGAADTTPPSLISIATPFANEQFSIDMTPSKIPSYSYTCGDPDGGPAPTCVGPTGGLTLTAGPHTVSVTSTNAAGLSFTRTYNWVVAAGFEDLMKCVPAIAGCTAPVAYYRLNEANDATTMKDAMGAHDGGFYNDTKNGGEGISGDSDTTRAFLGDGGYGAVNGITEPAQAYSMELWARIDDTNAMSLMQHGSSGALYINSAGKYVFRPEERGGTIVGPSAVADGEFHQVAGVWDGATATLYVDGAPAGSMEATNQPSGADTLYLGYGTEAPWLRGDLDEVSYYAVALSAGQVFAHFQADPPPAKAGRRAGAPAGDTTSTPVKTTTAPKKAASVRATAKAQVKALTRQLAKTKAKLKALRRQHASKRRVKAAQRAITTLQRKLAAAKRRLH